MDGTDGLTAPPWRVRVVSGNAVMGANIFRDLFAAIRDVGGGQAGAYEKVPNDGRDVALHKMTDESAARGINPVYLLQIETRRRADSLRTLAVVSRALEVEPDDLK